MDCYDCGVEFMVFFQLSLVVIQNHPPIFWWPSTVFKSSGQEHSKHKLPNKT